MDEPALDVPRPLEAGVYGDRLDAWFGRHQIVLDFGAISADEGWLATARVREPVTAGIENLPRARAPRAARGLAARRPA